MQSVKSVFVTGQTGIGKTSFALCLAAQFKGELISADSRQVYSDLNIGTGKYESPTELTSNQGTWRLKNIPIHGINITPLTQIWSAGDFAHYATAKIEEITQRGNLPIIVGGTGFYIKSLIEPDQTISVPQNNTLREEFIKLEKEHGTRSTYLITHLQERLSILDLKKLDSMNRSDRNNIRRLMRAIEVAEHRKHHPKISEHSSRTIPAKIIGLYASKEILREKIASRVEEMFANGYQSEVEALVAKYGWNIPAMNTIGYREWQPYINKSIGLEELKANIIQAHLKYARKQMLYLKRLSEINWFDITVNNWGKNAIEYCRDNT